MQENNKQQSSNIEIEQQLQQNADCYAYDEQIPNQYNNNKIFLTQGTLINSIPQKQITLEQIKLVSSILESGDGHIQSVKIKCKKCQKNVNTKIKRRFGEGACQVSCVLLLCSFGIICLACFPFIMEDCKDVIHICPECNYINGITPYKLFE